MKPVVILGKRPVYLLGLCEAASNRKPNHRCTHKERMIFSHPKVRGKQFLILVHGLVSRQIALRFSPPLSHSRIPTISSHSVRKSQVWPHIRTSALIGHDCVPFTEGRLGTGCSTVAVPFCCLFFAHGGSRVYTAGQIGGVAVVRVSRVISLTITLLCPPRQISDLSLML